jgi:zinc protease
MTLATVLCAAQAPKPASKSLVIKGKAPISKEVLKVKLPRAYETKLSNGLQVIVLEQHKLPSFAMQMVVLSGGMSDPDDQHGTAQATAGLLREGTKTRTSKQIAEQVDSLGASLVANSGLSSINSIVSASGLTDNFDQIMELFADVLLNPSFPADELNKFKARALAQLRLQRSQPGFLGNEMFNKVMYGSHPAGRWSLSADEIQKITPDTLLKFHALHYKPNNSIFAIVGDVKPAEIVARLEKTFGTWQRGDVPQTIIPKVSETASAKIYLINRVPSVQTNLTLGNLSVERTDPDYFALRVMDQVVGGGQPQLALANPDLIREPLGIFVGGLHGEAPLVIDVGLRDFRPMDLRFEQVN